jgi:hypothetical protein
MSVVRLHTIRYFGNFEQGFHRLTADTNGYFDRHGDGPKPLSKISDRVNGLHFRYMEMPAKEFVAVGVQRLILRTPVLLIPQRHTDGKGFASDPQFRDGSAMDLLVDMIVANPKHRDALGRFLIWLGKSSEVEKK